MSTFLVPYHAAIVEIHGNNMTIPRQVHVVICYPLSDTTYYLPKLSLEPKPGSYMSGQILQLRTYTAFEITITAAEGDTIMGESSCAMAGGNLLTLIYISGNDWQILANVNGGAVGTNAFIGSRAKAQTGAGSPVTTSSPVTSHTSTPRSMTPKIDDSRPLTKVNALPGVYELFRMYVPK
jgi:hypothetical protein